MYGQFAGVYDTLMEEIPYEEWFDALTRYLYGHGITGGTICELGCGTGTMTELFAGAGFRMIGVDISEDMLALAQEKKEKSGHDILYLHQDMRELNLAEPVDVILSVCDSMNYLVEEFALDKVLANVRKYLTEDGYLIFDMKTEYCYKQVIGNRTIVDQTDDMTCIWDNYYDESDRINEYAVTIFQRCQDTDKYGKFEEFHYQRAYLQEEVQDSLNRNGWKVVGIFDETMSGEPDKKSERIYFVCQKEQ